MRTKVPPWVHRWHGYSWNKHHEWSAPPGASGHGAGNDALEGADQSAPPGAPEPGSTKELEARISNYEKAPKLDADERSKLEQLRQELKQSKSMQEDRLPASSRLQKLESAKTKAANEFKRQSDYAEQEEQKLEKQRENTEKAQAAKAAAQEKYDKAAAELDEATSRTGAAMEVQTKPSDDDALHVLEERLGEDFLKENTEFFQAVRAQVARRKQEDQQRQQNLEAQHLEEKRKREEEASATAKAPPPRRRKEEPRQRSTTRSRSPIPPPEPKIDPEVHVFFANFAAWQAKKPPDGKPEELESWLVSQPPQSAKVEQFFKDQAAKAEAAEAQCS